MYLLIILKAVQLRHCLVPSPRCERRRVAGWASNPLFKILLVQKGQLHLRYVQNMHNTHMKDFTWYSLFLQYNITLQFDVQTMCVPLRSKHKEANFRPTKHVLTFKVLLYIPLKKASGCFVFSSWIYKQFQITKREFCLRKLQHTNYMIVLYCSYERQLGL